MFQIFEHKRINFRVQVIKEKDTFAKGRNTDSISLRIGKKMALVSWHVRVQTLLGDVASFGFKLDPLDTSKTRSLNVLSSAYFSSHSILESNVRCFQKRYVHVYIHPSSQFRIIFPRLENYIIDRFSIFV